MNFKSNTALSLVLAILCFLIITLCASLTGCVRQRNRNRVYSPPHLHRCEDEIVTPPALIMPPSPAKPWYQRRRPRTVPAIPVVPVIPGDVPGAAPSVHPQCADDDFDAEAVIPAYVTIDTPYLK